MDKTGIFWYTVMIIAILSVGNFFYGSFAQYSETYEKSKEYPIYYCSAPFGIIWVEETATGSFILFVGSYTSSGTLTESYNVKAFDGDELITKVFDATKISVVPDGTFYLEQSWSETITYSRTGKEAYTIVDKKRDHVWRIHIPMLPSLNETISVEWTFSRARGIG